MKISMKDFLTFRKMITPTIITIVFWLLCIMSVFATLGAFLRKDIFTGIIILILGPLFARIICEFIMVFFRINENLAKINCECSKK